MPAPCLLECTGRNAGVPLKLPGQVSLVGKSEIKGDQLTARHFGSQFHRPNDGTAALLKSALAESPSMFSFVYGASAPIRPCDLQGRKLGRAMS